jgi:hypothetical protein
MGQVQDLVRQREGAIGQEKAAGLAGEYTGTIRPAFVKRYGAGAVPIQIDIDMADARFNGNGGFGFVQVTGGVARHPDAAVRLFAVAHETGHGVVFREMLRLGVAPWAPFTDGEARLHEHMADLVAMRVLRENQPAVANAIVGSLGHIADALGPAFGDHPSGDARAALIRRLVHGEPFDNLFGALARKAG